MSGAVLMTATEIVAYLKKTSLPTIIVEGPDDIIIYRHFEKYFEKKNVSVLPAGGRTNVLAVFDLMKGVITKAKIAYIVDQDSWIYSTVPSVYLTSNIVCTDGYSIENDVFRDVDYLQLMSIEEISHFNKNIDLVVNWYSHRISELFTQNRFEVKTTVHELANATEGSNLHLEISSVPDHLIASKNFLHSDFARLVRGKQIMQCVSLILSPKKDA